MKKSGLETLERRRSKRDLSKAYKIFTSKEAIQLDRLYPSVN